MGCCEHGNEHLCFQNEGNFLMNWRNISFPKRTPLHAVSQLLTAATSSVSTHNQMYYRTMNSNHSVSSTNSTQCPLHCPLYTVCRYSERLLHCTFCSVFCQFRQQQLHCGSKQCCCVSELAKFGFLWRIPSGTVWRHSCVALCCWVAAFVELCLNIQPPLHVHSL